MSTTYQTGKNDAASGKGPADVSSQTWQTQQTYNAGYAAGKK